MSLEALEQRLDVLLITRSSFYNEYRSYLYDKQYLFCEKDTDVNKLTPTQVITKLHKLDFNFTVDHFNKFIICAMYKKSLSYIVNNTKKEVIDIMFTKFTPSILQIKILFDCYKYSNGYYYWIDTLIKKEYNFSDKLMKRLEDIGYNVSNLHMISSIKNGDIEYIFHNIQNKHIMSILLEKTYNITGNKENIDSDSETDSETDSEYKKEVEDKEGYIGYFHYDEDKDKTKDEIEKITKTGLKDFINTIKNIIKKHKIILTTEHINIVISALDWYGGYNRLKENISIIKMLLSIGCKLNIQCLYNLTNKTEYLDIFILLLKHIDIKKTSKKNDLINVLKHVCKRGMWIHVLYLLKLSVKPDGEMLSIYFNNISKYGAISINLPKILNYPENIIKKYRKDTIFNLYEYLFDLGTKPDAKTLLHICGSSDIKNFNNFIKIIVPTKECLDVAVEIGNIHMIMKILEHNIIADIDTYNNLLHCIDNIDFDKKDIETLQKMDGEKFKCLSNESVDDFLNLIFNYILDKLIDNGLKITKEMAISALQNAEDLHIFKLERFGIEYDENIYFNCYKNNIVSPEYHQQFINNIGLHRINLRILNKINTKNEFIKYIKEHNIKPDRYCIDYASNNKKFMDIHTYMIHVLKCETMNYTLYKTCIKSGMDPDSFILKGYNSEIKITKDYMMKIYDHIDLDKI